MSDPKIDPNVAATTLGNMKQDAKKIAQTLKNWSEGAQNPPASAITNQINQLIEGLVPAVKAMDVWFEDNDPRKGEHDRLRTAWQELQDSWDRTYPKGIKSCVRNQTWKDCSEKAEEFSRYMAEWQ